MAYKYRDSHINFSAGGGRFRGRFSRAINEAAREAAARAATVGLAMAEATAPVQSGRLQEGLVSETGRAADGHTFYAMVYSTAPHAEFIEPHNIPNSFNKGEDYGFGWDRKKPGRGYPTFFHPGTGDTYLRKTQKIMDDTLISELERRLP